MLLLCIWILPIISAKEVSKHVDLGKQPGSKRPVNKFIFNSRIT